MNAESTVEQSEGGSIHGDKSYERLSRRVLPILVRQAKAKHPITYYDLAAELDVHHRTLNWPLGLIGNELKRLSKKWDADIPQIQCLAINKNTRLPGPGYLPFIESILKPKAASDQNNIRIIINSLQWKAYGYSSWDMVLKHFAIAPLPPISMPPSFGTDSEHSGAGEGPEHLALKQWVAANPKAIGLSPLSRSELEVGLLSGDIVDVVFETKHEVIGVEVKSFKSGHIDLMRGLLQCVKYQAVLQAQLSLKSDRRLVRVILALDHSLAGKPLEAKNTLGISSIEDLYTARTARASTRASK